jgi:hypothetical protein
LGGVGGACRAERVWEEKFEEFKRTLEPEAGGNGTDKFAAVALRGGFGKELQQWILAYAPAPVLASSRSLARSLSPHALVFSLVCFVLPGLVCFLLSCVCSASLCLFSAFLCLFSAFLRALSRLFLPPFLLSAISSCGAVVHAGLRSCSTPPIAPLLPPPFVSFPEWFSSPQFAFSDASVSTAFRIVT